MNVVVLVPRRAGDPWRDRLWDHVRSTWADVGLPVVEGHHDDGPFNRSAAINTAAVTAGRWSVAVIADADTVVAGDQVLFAVGIAVSRQRAVLAYDEFVSLDKPGTEKVLAGSAPELGTARWSDTSTVSSCIVVPRTLWDEVGGFDARFRGWGFEDRAFYLACRDLGGGHVDRVHGPAWHLWHPRSSEKNANRPEFRANRELADRYRAAHADGTMRRFLAEM